MWGGVGMCVCGGGGCLCVHVCSKHTLMWSLEETESSGEFEE